MEAFHKSYPKISKDYEELNASSAMASNAMAGFGTSLTADMIEKSMEKVKGEMVKLTIKVDMVPLMLSLEQSEESLKKLIAQKLLAPPTAAYPVTPKPHFTGWPTHPNAPSPVPFDKPSQSDTIHVSNPIPAKKGNMNAPVLTIFRFGPKTDGNASMKDVLGGKGAGLAEMSKLGIPVPPGFTIPCEASVYYNAVAMQEEGVPFSNTVTTLLAEGDAYLTKHFKYAPLLSVRSGARVSMPGMMDTILNVGLTDATLPEWEKRIGMRAARDSYRRLIQMYASVVFGVKMAEFDDELTQCKKAFNVTTDSELDEVALITLVEVFKEICETAGCPFPQTREEQLNGAAFAVFNSWNNQRAKDYRKEFNIPDDWGTAVTVQSMVFGNMNDKSATGVLFSRDPSTGNGSITGDFLVNAQGEDVVAGIRTPEPIGKMDEWNNDLFVQLESAAWKLEKHYKDMQDIEFTVQDGKLYLLQCRSGKRSARAAFRIAFDMATEGIITKEEACARVTAEQFLTMLRPSINPAFKTPPSFVGIPAGGGVVAGVAVLSADAAINCTEPCILVREETDPDDFKGMSKSVGILTATGGLTSHAAVVARGMDKTCVVGATALKVESHHATYQPAAGDAVTFAQGAMVTIDGMTGNVWIGVKVPVIEGGVPKFVKEVIGWMGNNTAERLLFTPENICEQIEQSTAEILYVDLCMMDSSKVVPSLLDISQAVNNTKAKQVVIDLCPMSVHYGPQDMAFVRMFGIDASEIESKQHAMIAATIKTGEWDKKKLLLKLPDNSLYGTTLRKAGFRVLGSIQTVADLLNASGPIQVTDAVIENVFGGKDAYEKVKTLAGVKDTAPMPEPTYWYQPIFNKGV